MAQFRGLTHGNRGPATRLGTKESGLRSEAQSYQGKVVTVLWHDFAKNQDMARVFLDTHFGGGKYQQLFYGPISGEVSNGPTA